MAKLLTVFGATGQQGGALIDHVLGSQTLSSQFTVRGISRNVSSPASIALKDRGVEMVEADLNQSSSLEKAVASSHAVFAVTNFWEQRSAEVEIAQGKSIADAAVRAGAVQIIWSSLPNVTKMSGGEITGAKHFDSKAFVEEYIRTLDIKSLFFMPGWFMQNHLHIMKPQLVGNGTYEFSQPWEETSLIPLIDIRDTGKFIEPALLDPTRYDGKNFTCATKFYTPVEMVDSWTKVTGKTVRLQSVTDGTEHSTMPEEQRRELKKAGGLITKYSYYGPSGKADLAWTLEQLAQPPTSWERFLQDFQPWFQD
ncbi:hypothetical protein BX600DRAFT_502226 [Xylariales sp. PMI_506]|nr:hypothetical protein BX600DRAFT_502226 [Xylariales sp. PMI_506]